MTPLDWVLIDAFVRSFQNGGPVLEIGARQLGADGNPQKDLRSFFPAATYVGMDIERGPGVDCVMDAAQLAVRDRSIGLVVMVSTIEHVFGLFDALRNIVRVVTPSGAVILTSHMDRGIHAYPADYWRFTPEAFARLLDPFAAKLVGYQGRANNPQNVFAVGFKECSPGFEARATSFRECLEETMSVYAENQAFGERMKRLRRLIFWRLCGSKESYRKLRHEHVIGWHTFPSASATN